MTPEPAGYPTRRRPQTPGGYDVAAEFEDPQCRGPPDMSLYMKLKQQLDDPATVELCRDLAAMIDWEADDPRVAAVGDRLVASLETADAEGWENHDQEITDELAELLDSVFLDSVPIARRLMQRLEESGWRG